MFFFMVQKLMFALVEQLLVAVLSRSAHLDVVEVDFNQAAVVVVDSLQSFLHIGGVGRLVGEDLEWIWFHYTCRRRNITAYRLQNVIQSMLHSLYSGPERNLVMNCNGPVINVKFWI